MRYLLYLIIFEIVSHLIKDYLLILIIQTVM